MLSLWWIQAEPAGQPVSCVQGVMPQYPPLNCVRHDWPLSVQSDALAHSAPTPRSAASLLHANSASATIRILTDAPFAGVRQTSHFGRSPATGRWSTSSALDWSRQPELNRRPTV